MSAKKIFILGFIVVLLIAIPLTIYVLQQQQETRSRATQATVVSFEPSVKKDVKVGDVFTLDISVDPGSNIVTLVQLFITYDPTKLATASADNIGTGLVPNDKTVPVVLQSPKYTQNSISVSLSPGANVSNFIQTKTKVATLVMRALNPTDATSTQIIFVKDNNQTDIRSTGTADQPSENVLSNIIPASITINSSPSSSSPSNNQPPTCTALNVDRTASGSAPFAITFTAAGNDSDGTISKTTFSFGDGGVNDVDKNNGTNGIGTNSVNAQISHTYQNPGTFTATAVLTDNQGGVSATTNCNQAITVTQPDVVPTASASASLTSTTIFVTATPIPDSSQANPTIIPPGPGETILKIGGVGVVLSILGGILFLAL